MTETCAWYEEKAYSDNVARRITDLMTALGRHREYRIAEIAALAWCYERDRWIARHSRGAAPIPQAVIDRCQWLGGTDKVPPQLNLVKSAVDTLLAWLMTDLPALDVLADGARFEDRRQIEARSLALASTFDNPEAKAAYRRIGRDGLLKGFGAVWPRIRAGRLEHRRLHWHQIITDPCDARDSEPTWCGVVEMIDRRHFLAWYRGLTKLEIPSHDARRRLIEALPRLSRNANGIAMDSVAWLGPYDWELQHAGLADVTDRLQIVHLWMPSTAPGASDGRYVCLAYGGGAAFDAGRQLNPAEAIVCIDKTFERTTLPVCWWSPFPADEGIDGCGLGQVFLPWQESADRSLFKIQRTMDKYGHAKVIVQKGAIQNIESFLQAGITIVPVDGWDEKPQLVQPNALSQEDLVWIDRCMSMAKSVHGINDMMSQGLSQRGAGASGVAMLEETERQLDRVNDVREEMEGFYIRTGRETLHAIDDACAADPSFAARYRDRNGEWQQRAWRDIIGMHQDYQIRTEAAGPLGRTRSGRLAKTLDLAQRGLMDPQLAADALMSSPDVRAMARLETADMRLVEAQLTELADPSGDHSWAMPDADTPLELAVRMSTRMIALARAQGAEEETIMRLREYKRSAEAQLADMQATLAPPQPMMPAPVDAPVIAQPMPMG